jgi:hypothetical protein
MLAGIARKVALLLTCGGCAGAGPAPEATPATAPVPVPAPAASPPAPSAPLASSPAQDPAPLRAGTDGGFAPSTSGRVAPTCAADTIRRTLEAVVAECRPKGAALCGEIKVRASADGKSVQVALDVTKDSFDDSFSRCVTSKLDAVAWRCTLPGSDTTLDLGCEL